MLITRREHKLEKNVIGRMRRNPALCQHHPQRGYNHDALLLLPNPESQPTP
jgi:hypothetical protein